MTAETLYPAAFYETQRDGSFASAEAILPIVFDLMRPTSVLDIGCGVGTWLGVARKLGARRVIGYDGSHVAPEMRIDPAIELCHIDLERETPSPTRVDLAMSVEVVEHVSATAGARIVDCLCSSADVVLFSGAIPGQGGTGHINEQWQSYWARLFRERGYVAADVVRPKVWSNEVVEPWYAQNTLLYLKHGPAAAPAMLDVVHPRLWTQPSPRMVLGHLPRVLRRALRRAIRGRF